MPPRRAAASPKRVAASPKRCAHRRLTPLVNALPRRRCACPCHSPHSALALRSQDPQVRRHFLVRLPASEPSIATRRCRRYRCGGTQGRARRRARQAVHGCVAVHDVDPLCQGRTRLPEHDRARVRDEPRGAPLLRGAGCLRREQGRRARALHAADVQRKGPARRCGLPFRRRALCG